MKKLIYSVYDKVGEVYHNPWIEASDMTAARAFKFACADENSLYGMCPSDFVLYRVGDFDDKTGLLSFCSYPEKVLECRGDEDVPY